jgi:phage I-like protein
MIPHMTSPNFQSQIFRPPCSIEPSLDDLPRWPPRPDGVTAYAAPTGDAVKAALSVALPEGTAQQLPDEIQYMPPGRHRIRATRGGKPVELEIEITATTATALSDYLTRQLALTAAGAEDKPFLDFNHEDREAAAWPLKIFWGGDDPRSGGVRAKIEWSGAGRQAIADRTFRRFSPTFLLDAAGRVIGSETNMGGLVNRAAFKRIQPLFARETGTTPGNAALPVGTPASATPGNAALPVGAPTSVTPGNADLPVGAPHHKPSTNHHAPGPAETPMNELLQNLLTLGLIEATATAEADIIAQVTTKVTALQSDSTALATAKERLTALETERDAALRAKAESQVDAAIQAGRIPPKDENAKSFWIEALTRDEPKALQALATLAPNPALATIVTARDTGGGPLQNQEALQLKKLNDLKAANPAATFETIFAKAQAEAPELFN